MKTFYPISSDYFMGQSYPPPLLSAIHSLSDLLNLLARHVLNHEELEVVFQMTLKREEYLSLLDSMVNELIGEQDDQKIMILGTNYQKLLEYTDAKKGFGSANDVSSADLSKIFADGMISQLSEQIYHEKELSILLLKTKFIKDSWVNVLKCFEDWKNNSLNLIKNFEKIVQIIESQSGLYDCKKYDQCKGFLDRKIIYLIDNISSSEIKLSDIQFYLDEFSSYTIKTDGVLYYSDQSYIPFEKGDNLLIIFIRSLFCRNHDDSMTKLANLKTIGDFILSIKDTNQKHLKYRNLFGVNVRNKDYREVVEEFIFEKYIGLFLTDFDRIKCLLPYLLSFKSIKYPDLKGESLYLCIVREFLKKKNEHLKDELKNKFKILNDLKYEKSFLLSAFDLFKKGNNSDDNTPIFKFESLENHAYILEKSGYFAEPSTLGCDGAEKVMKHLCSHLEPFEVILALKRALYIDFKDGNTFLHKIAEKFASQFPKAEEKETARLVKNFKLMSQYICESFCNIKNDCELTFRDVFLRTKQNTIKDFFAKRLSEAQVRDLIETYSVFERCSLCKENFLHTLFGSLLSIQNGNTVYRNLEILHRRLESIIQRKDKNSYDMELYLFQRNASDQTFLDVLEEDLFSNFLPALLTSKQNQDLGFAIYLLDMKASKKHDCANEGESFYDVLIRHHIFSTSELDKMKSKSKSIGKFSLFKQIPKEPEIPQEHNELDYKNEESEEEIEAGISFFTPEQLAQNSVSLNELQARILQEEFTLKFEGWPQQEEYQARGLVGKIP